MRYPVNYIGITNYPHYGQCIDFGWNPNYGGQKVPIYSVEEGTVYKIKESQAYGKQIFINHSNGMRSGYTHLSTILVTTGQKVLIGQQIGNMGNTGTNANGAYHLHFALLKQDNDLDYGDYDPFKYLEVYPDQVVGENTLKKYGSQIKYYSNDNNNFWYVFNVDDEGLNVRNAPNGTIIANICFGTPVRVYENSSGWSRLGTNKWVYSAYLTRVQLDSYIVTSKDGLNIRDKPSTSGKLLRTMPYGTIVGIYETSGSWVKISPKQECWCSKNYLAGICPNPYPGGSNN